MIQFIYWKISNRFIWLFYIFFFIVYEIQCKVKKLPKQVLTTSFQLKTWICMMEWKINSKIGIMFINNINIDMSFSVPVYYTNECCFGWRRWWCSVELREIICSWWAYKIICTTGELLKVECGKTNAWNNFFDYKPFLFLSRKFFKAMIVDVDCFWSFCHWRKYFTRKLVGSQYEKSNWVKYLMGHREGG